MTKFQEFLNFLSKKWCWREYQKLLNNEINYSWLLSRLIYFNFFWSLSLRDRILLAIKLRMRVGVKKSEENFSKEKSSFLILFFSWCSYQRSRYKVFLANDLIKLKLTTRWILSHITCFHRFRKVSVSRQSHWIFCWRILKLSFSNFSLFIVIFH